MRSASGTVLHGRWPSRASGDASSRGSITSGSCLGQHSSEQQEPQSCFTAQPQAVTWPQVTQQVPNHAFTPREYDASTGCTVGIDETAVFARRVPSITTV